MPDVRLVAALLGSAGMTDDGDNIIHFNPWRDFNDAPAVIDDDPFDLEADPAQIAVFLDVVFGYCEGWIPFRGFIDKGQGFAGRPHNIWVEADGTVAEKAVNFAAWAAREGAAFYVVPGTVAESGRAKSADIRQMQTVVVDLDAGDIAAKLDHLLAASGRADADRRVRRPDAGGARQAARLVAADRAGGRR